MTYAELIDRISEILPGATVGEDLDGQLVVYTNYRLLEDDTIVSLEMYEDDATEPACRNCDKPLQWGSYCSTTCEDMDRLPPPRSGLSSD